MVHILINNYKAQKNVRAELGGAVDLGEPVSLYIAEDEVKVNTPNLVINGTFDEDANWTKGTGWTISGGTASCDGSQSSTTQLHQENTVNFVDTYKHIWQIVFTVSGYGAGTVAPGMGGYNFESTVNANGTYKVVSNPTNTSSNRRIYFHASDDFVGSIDNVKVYKVSDHTYKLMAVNDTIPASNINAEAGEGAGTELSDLLNGDQETALADSLAADNNSFDFATGTSTLIGTNMFTGTTATFTNKAAKGRHQNSSGQAKVTLPLITVVGRRYDVEFDVSAVSGVTVTVSLSATTDVDTGSQATGIGVSTDNNLNAPFTATGVESYLVIQNSDGDGTDYVELDDLKVYEVFGYDYYNAPAYKFGIVSSVYDQDTGAMKTVGAAGDQVDVTVQGECNVVRTDGSNQDVDKDYPIKRIMNDGQVHDSAIDDNMFPNAVGVITETNDSSTTAKIILFQGVEFSEHFVHKNSLQVHAKCAETIIKFRPVSLYLDSAGDLLCRHDDIPEEFPSPDTDHTGVDPGKWGVAELGGVSGELIPVTVAGKTHINPTSTLTAGYIIRRIYENGTTASSSYHARYSPNALGTIMETGTVDVPITIFGGTPIGTITDWKRTIKVTAKANGAITQYCPVSLYLDQYGEYECISDDIPNDVTDTTNAIWVDFRKWGIAQETVADGEFVEVIVQGRTNVVDAVDGANREDFILKISSSGGVTGGAAGATAAYALSSLGIVEKESQVSDGAPGVIIIF